MKIFPPLVFLIFALGVLFRFIYFPQNIYFGYDQARDLYSTLSLLKGDMKVVGPPSSFNDNLFHGPLVYYLYAPVIYLSSASPELLSLFLRILNCLGIFLTFLIGLFLFNRRVGLLVAFLFAVSYEQSQYALFLGHPALAVIPILSYYLGLALLFFKNNQKGLLLSAISLGLSIQFHYVHILLLPGLAFLLVYFRPKLSYRNIFFSFAGFLAAVSTFFISEIKYDFRLMKGAIDAGGSGGGLDIGYGITMLHRMVSDNFGFGLVILAALVILKSFEKKAIFLIIWLLSGILPYVLTKSPSYYYGAGASVSLLIVAALVVDKIWSKLPVAAVSVLAALTVINLNSQINFNKKGPNLDMVIQPQMLLSDEKQVLDYIYQQSEGKPISVKGLTVPLSVNTTWSYLFEWYGKSRYGYLPIWIGPIAQGYPGNLPVSSSRSDLPQTQFLIIEPTIGIREGTKDQFFEEEGYFTKVVEEKQFGQFKVQKRKRY